MPESLFNKVAGLQACKFLKRLTNTGVFLWMLRNFLEHLFWKTSVKIPFSEFLDAFSASSNILDSPHFLSTNCILRSSASKDFYIKWPRPLQFNRLQAATWVNWKTMRTVSNCTEVFYGKSWSEKFRKIRRYVGAHYDLVHQDQHCEKNVFH